MDDLNLTTAVGEAIQKPEFLEKLQKILDDTDISIAKLKPTCKACGKCCHFEEMPHRLYASTGEIALLTMDTPPPQSSPLVCPYQQGDSCTNRKSRPLGCRTFFCKEFQKNPITTLLQDVYENSHRKITKLHAQYGICYQYCELTEGCVELSCNL
jgi:Fe-S-cluster containining protein